MLLLLFQSSQALLAIQPNAQIMVTYYDQPTIEYRERRSAPGP